VVSGHQAPENSELLSERNVATTGRTGKALAGSLPDPRNTRTLVDQREQLDVKLANDPAFVGLLPQYRYVVDQAFRRWGHGHRNEGVDGLAWFDQRELARVLGVNAKLVQRALTAAEEAGVLSKERQYWGNSQRWTYNAYRLADRFHRTPASSGPLDTSVQSEQEQLRTGTTPTPTTTTTTNQGDQGVLFESGVSSFTSSTELQIEDLDQGQTLHRTQASNGVNEASSHDDGDWLRASTLTHGVGHELHDDGKTEAERQADAKWVEAQGDGRPRPLPPRLPAGTLDDDREDES
jgi:hypothetical protein